jgi:hypothetical protein
MNDEKKRRLPLVRASEGGDKTMLPEVLPAPATGTLDGGADPRGRTMRHMRKLLAAAAVGGFAATTSRAVFGGPGADPPPPPPDAGVDAGADAGADATTDAEAGADAMVTTFDSGYGRPGYDPAGPTNPSSTASSTPGETSSCTCTVVGKR